MSTDAKPVVGELDDELSNTLAAREMAFLTPKGRGPGQLTSCELLVYLALLQHDKKRVGNAWPGQGRLSTLTGLSHSTVAAAIKKLEADGWCTIVRDKWTAAGDRDANTYTFKRFTWEDVKVLQKNTRGGCTAPRGTPPGGTPVPRQAVDGTPPPGGGVPRQAVIKDLNGTLKPKVCAEEEGVRPSSSAPLSVRKAGKGKLSENDQKAWTIIERIHGERQERAYGHAGKPAKISLEIRQEICSHFLEAASEVQQLWQAVSPTFTFADAFRWVVNETLHHWMQQDDDNGVLEAKRHGLFLLPGDLCTLDFAWRDGLDDQIAAAKGKKASA